MLEYQCAGRQLESHYLKRKKNNIWLFYIEEKYDNSELPWIQFYNMNYLVVLLLARSLSKSRLLGLC